MKMWVINAAFIMVIMSLRGCVEQDSNGRIEQKNSELNITSENHQPRELNAYNMATEMVVKALQEPTTAQFPRTKEKLEHIESLGSNRFRIDSWVDSQDTYGAITRRCFSLIFRIDSLGITKEEFIIEEIGYIPEKKIGVQD